MLIITLLAARNIEKKMKNFIWCNTSQKVVKGKHWDIKFFLVKECWPVCEHYYINNQHLLFQAITSVLKITEIKACLSMFQMCYGSK